MPISAKFIPARSIRTLGLTLVLALLAGGAAAQNGQVFSQASPDAPMVHVPSGFSFPAHIGAFERGQVIQYTQEGDDVSVGYDEAQSGIVATLYVYPTHGRSLAEEFSGRQQEVNGSYTKVELISTGKAQVTPKHQPAMLATYLLVAEIKGQPRKLRSELLVAQAGKWFVEYRISYPAENQAAAQPRVNQLKQAFAWP